MAQISGFFWAVLFPGIELPGCFLTLHLLSRSASAATRHRDDANDHRSTMWASEARQSMREILVAVASRMAPFTAPASVRYYSFGHAPLPWKRTYDGRDHSRPIVAERPVVNRPASISPEIDRPGRLSLSPSFLSGFGAQPPAQCITLVPVEPCTVQHNRTELLCPNIQYSRWKRRRSSRTGRVSKPSWRRSAPESRLGRIPPMRVCLLYVHKRKRWAFRCPRSWRPTNGLPPRK